MATTWIVAADSARARIFEMTPRDEHCREIDDLLNPDGRLQNREINSDADGRFRSVGQPNRAHSSGQRITPAEHKTDVFSKEVGRYLDKARTQNRYEKLFVIAPPEFLGMMRQNMTRETQKLVEGEINKDLSQGDALDIERCVAETRRK